MDFAGSPQTFLLAFKRKITGQETVSLLREEALYFVGGHTGHGAQVREEAGSVLRKAIGRRERKKKANAFLI